MVGWMALRIGLLVIGAGNVGWGCTQENFFRDFLITTVIWGAGLITAAVLRGPSGQRHN
jgi:hypothetical protein